MIASPDKLDSCKKWDFDAGGMGVVFPVTEHPGGMSWLQQPSNRHFPPAAADHVSPLQINC